MRKEWNPQDCKLYRYAEGNDVTSLSGRVANYFCEELRNKAEYEFIRDCTEFKELMTQMSR